MGSNDFTNRGPRIFPTSDLGGLIEDVRINKFLYSFTMPRQWNNQDNINTWGTHQGKSQGEDMQATGVFPGNVQRPTSLDPYSTQSRKGIQNLQEKGWQTQKPEHRHPVLVKFMAKFLQKIQHLILQKYWSQETRKRNIFQNMGETYTVRGKCACIIFWKNVETQIAHSIMHRQNNWIHNMHPMYAQ